MPLSHLTRLTQTHSVEPNADGQYTIPTIRLPDDTWVMDSFKIADVLESRYPTPSLHLDSPVCKKVKHIVARAMPAFYRNFMPLVPERLLTQRSQDYWYATRKQILDMGPDPEAWRKAGPVLQEATALLKETAGPFFLGKDFSFADVIWISLLIFWKRIGDDVFEKFLEAAGDKDLHLAMMEAAKEWTARDGKGE